MPAAAAVDEEAETAKDPKVLAALGHELVRASDREGAERAFRDACAADPSDAVSLFSLGELLSQRGETDEAIAAFRAAIKADPSHAHAHIELGMLLSQGVDWSFYGVWRVAVGILCWALVIGGVACYLMYDFSDDDTAPHSE